MNESINKINQSINQSINLNMTVQPWHNDYLVSWLSYQSTN